LDENEESQSVSLNGSKKGARGNRQEKSLLVKKKVYLRTSPKLVVMIERFSESKNMFCATCSQDAQKEDRSISLGTKSSRADGEGRESGMGSNFKYGVGAERERGVVKSLI